MTLGANIVRDLGDWICFFDEAGQGSGRARKLLGGTPAGFGSRQGEIGPCRRWTRFLKDVAGTEPCGLRA
ncbi:hypothetical protein GCM10010177_81140 [Actinomadura citrea]|nr:hypothetical protein GCM10010177_81140 [Actinomadura citrea]